ncbi:MAG TPA: transcriptional regulator [Candidatus Peribacter riflensis]|uniref:HxlR family transcriptional regulator n=1 Tax=Candidatus Peribacter riflensis TaxID=1735162 RepID=A0A0S1SLQ3_9BACT|nr:MAG: HxlR family transcriptional regulator [Candidatus Peribacter riflensis]OGJ77828.1 MAG: hypothetical protein A2398_00970 [Candidatus Peribacteria bacterium RIFOXYB1_FULL_57_12]OGJ80258.1 MAG: hypothetical protein A2412_01225 [Candidatus Peribacteria bacterium RIFOXYC1_FULL_58_8]ALM11247.1 MAG: HxlR family transcriptional regulator [Candidatus Peribacter riflensis]ALM12349.1 MAG: HxlR family transcriptional regulator [Candidatus Peribacter riflensis]
MKPPRNPRSSCPISCVIEKLSKKWNLLILESFRKGKKLRFSEIIEELPTINSRILSQRLTELEREGLIVRTVAQAKPITISYVITEKGMALQDIFEHYAVWVRTWGIASVCQNCYVLNRPQKRS